ncbi:MAG: hypothetical protein AABY32_00620 [Nanoarchaeota archaeon]
MKAKIYEISVCTDIIHGWHKTIKEIYIPGLKLYINKEATFIGEKEDNRFKESANIKEIVLSNNDYEDLVELKEILIAKINIEKKMIKKFELDEDFSKKDMKKYEQHFKGKRK